jgi:hypothetical protein
LTLLFSLNPINTGVVDVQCVNGTTNVSSFSYFHFNHIKRSSKESREWNPLVSELRGDFFSLAHEVQLDRTKFFGVGVSYLPNDFKPFICGQPFHKDYANTIIHSAKCNFKRLDFSERSRGCIGLSPSHAQSLADGRIELGKLLENRSPSLACPSGNLRNIEVGGAFCQETRENNSYPLMAPDLAVRSRVYSVCLPMGYERSAISGNNDVVMASQNDNGGSFCDFLGPRSRGEEQDEKQERKNSRVRYFTLGHRLGITVLTRNSNGDWVFDARAQDIDVSEDGVHWFHLIGDVCDNELLPW